MVQVFVRNLRSRSVAYELEPECYVSELKAQIEAKEGIPSTSQGLVYSGRQLQDDACVSDYGVSKDSTLHLVLRLRGGKGGFGALLRGQGRDGKLTTNFDACRDLQGRRIRHQRTEEELREWARQSKERELEKIATQHIKEMAKQQRAEAREKVNLEAIIEEQKRAIDGVHAAVKDALAHQPAGSSLDAASSKRKQDDNAVTEAKAKPAKKSKMLSALEEVTSSDSDSD